MSHPSLIHFGISATEILPAAFSFDSEWMAGATDRPIVSINPTNNAALATVGTATHAEHEIVVNSALKAFDKWKHVPAPTRGLMVRSLGEELRREKEYLSAIISLEMGKILAEARGEVQEMIDMCDFSVGLSRQLYGLTMHSERPGHRMYEQWHPLGVVGVITAFNFPMAVWAWNAVLAAVCGNSVVWKPSPLTPLCAHAIQLICNRVTKDHDCEGIFGLLQGDSDQGALISADPRIPLVSATGSTRMGKLVGATVGARLGRTLLELGGNNAIIVDESASIDLAVRAILFAAVGTSGQRCTSLRRLLVHSSIKGELLARLTKAYEQIRIGNPLDDNTLMGPLINNQAVSVMQAVINEAKQQGGTIISQESPVPGGGSFAGPVIIEMKEPTDITKQETFAPILYVISFDTIDEAIRIQNDVPQGLSSAIFTQNLLNSEKFLAVAGSDCGIANVNIGTSGAEIGGAFGGEKETGGGREAGSDSWKAYMRRQTTTINWSGQLPLAQGIRFG